MESIFSGLTRKINLIILLRKLKLSNILLRKPKLSKSRALEYILQNFPQIENIQALKKDSSHKDIQYIKLFSSTFLSFHSWKKFNSKAGTSSLVTLANKIVLQTFNNFRYRFFN